MDDLRKAAKAVLDYWESAAFGDAVMVDKMDALRTALEQPTADAPLPRPSIRDHLGFSTGTYTADQMLAFRAEGVAQERERCAKVCEGPFGVNSALNDEEAYYGRQMAGAIRKGLDKSQEV